ncbi:MAG: response regulator transcription factor [Epsilonproteobacteria bacterium]|nr:response regulator transcription factor [Campylobacterota bacterium]
MNRRNLDILSGFNVLYIEDEPQLLKHTATVLEDFVKNIFPVLTCKDAIDVIQKNNIDIIITDINLKHENGIEFLKELKYEFGYEIPAIVATAYTDAEYLIDAIKLKVEDYIVKPINLKDLLNSIHDVLLPMAQQKEIKRFYNMIKTISAVTDGKQVELVKFILKNLDDESMFNYSYGDIMSQVDVSKPTVIKFFRQLAQKGILTKIQNKKYFFNENSLPNPSEEIDAK